MTEKRSRGRPPGEGKKDGAHLAKVADIMVARKMKKPTTAMRTYIVQSGLPWKETDSTLIRRWQVKWKANSEALLEAARRRAQPVDRSVAGASYAYSGRNDIERRVTGYASPNDIPLHVQTLLGISPGLHSAVYESPIEAMLRQEREIRNSILGTQYKSPTADLFENMHKSYDPIFQSQAYEAATRAALRISNISPLDAILDQQFHTAGLGKFPDELLPFTLNDTFQPLSYPPESLCFVQDFPTRQNIAHRHREAGQWTKTRLKSLFGE